VSGRKAAGAGGSRTQCHLPLTAHKIHLASINSLGEALMRKKAGSLLSTMRTSKNSIILPQKKKIKYLFQGVD
jgi:hypothetical protein